MSRSSNRRVLLDMGCIPKAILKVCLSMEERRCSCFGWQVQKASRPYCSWDCTRARATYTKAFVPWSQGTAARSLMTGKWRRVFARGWFICLFACGTENAQPTSLSCFRISSARRVVQWHSRARSFFVKWLNTAESLRPRSPLLSRSSLFTLVSRATSLGSQA